MASPTTGKTISSTATFRLDQSLDEVTFERMSTGLQELNRVLGGGLVEGSFVLLGGAPGVGKSTLLIQTAAGLTQSKNQTVLYISGEESVAQTANRAQRLGLRSAQCEIGSENNLNEILALARAKKPSVLIVDSIQTVYLPELESAPGSVSQVRECAGKLMMLAKNENISVILIGHITKDGSLAGPKVLEHMVDCVLSFEGDSGYPYRLLRSLKNRFGAAQELGVFEMNSLGLREVLNPSEFFLQDRKASSLGSSVFAALEGSRPLLCEIQALTLASQMPMPRRTSVGIELQRLNMISAVLERHLGVKLGFSEIYINVAGGLKLSDPASDLAVAAALLSTDWQTPLPALSVFIGELGLTGEIRSSPFIDQRIKEALRLGFEIFYISEQHQKNLKDWGLDLKGKKIVFLKNVYDLKREILQSKKPIDQKRTLENPSAIF